MNKNVKDQRRAKMVAVGGVTRVSQSDDVYFCFGARALDTQFEVGYNFVLYVFYCA